MSKRDKKTWGSRRCDVPKSSNQGEKSTEEESEGLVVGKKPVIKDTTS